MNRSKLYKLMACLMFVASAVITIMLMLENVTGFIPCIIAIIQGLGAESAKAFFSVDFLTTTFEKNPIRKGVMGVLALFAFLISLIATVGFGMVMTNSVINDKMYNSTEYAEKQDNRETLKKAFDTKQKEIEALQASKENTLTDMAKQRDAWGKNYKTMKENAQKAINTKEKEFTDIINSKSNELSEISKKLEQSVTKETDTAGFSVLYNTIAEKLNNSKSKAKDKKPITAEEVSFWINLILAVSLEGFACGFVYLAEQERTGINIAVRETTNKQVGFKPQFVTATMSNNDEIEARLPEIPETSRKIGFSFSNPSSSDLHSSDNTIKHYGITNVESTHVETAKKQDSNSLSNLGKSGTQDINQRELEAYIDYMYKTAKGNVSRGYVAIGKELGLSQECCRKIRGFLERHGIITLQGSNTIILKPKSECNFNLRVTEGN